jgi:hypothetical protein
LDVGSVFEARSLSGTVAIDTRDGRHITTDQVTVRDSVLVVHSVIVDGRRQTQEPVLLGPSDIEMITRTATNWPLILAVGAPILVAGIVWIVVAYQGASIK